MAITHFKHIEVFDSEYSVHRCQAETNPHEVTIKPGEVIVTGIVFALRPMHLISIKILCCALHIIPIEW